jgi:hypothetical protein
MKIPTATENDSKMALIGAAILAPASKVNINITVAR